MSYIEKTLRFGLVGMGLVTGCSSTLPPQQTAEGAERPVSERATGGTARHTLAPPHAVRNWAELREQAALRLMAANPEGTYEGPVVEPLLGIPVLEIELNGDGTVRRITVLRHPQEAREVSVLAEQAVRRAAPFGDVTRLPRPWRFTETFLFNDERKFKPRTLDR